MESQAVAVLHLLNAGFVAALGNSDTDWYEIHLRQDFVCTLADGHRIDKREFVRRIEEQKGRERLACDEVDVHPIDDVALVHAVIHRPSDGPLALTRYTIVWHSQRGRWQALAAQFTPMIDTRNAVDTDLSIARLRGRERSRAGRLSALARAPFLVR